MSLRSQIAKKLRGFADSQAQAARIGGARESAAAGSLHGVVRLLEALTNDDKDGRVLLHVEVDAAAARPGSAASISASAATTAAAAAASTTAAAAAAAASTAAAAAADSAPFGSYLKILHLNPSVYFSTVLKDAHSVVLAGGTMQPFADLEQQLFHRYASAARLCTEPSTTFHDLPPTFQRASADLPWPLHSLPAGRVRSVSYGHIVPPANLLPLVLPTGPTGTPLRVASLPARPLTAFCSPSDCLTLAF